MGIAVGDYDHDGLPDLYVTGYGHNVLYHNLGNCKFKNVTERAGVKAGGFSTGAACADYNRDGHLDLFVPRYTRTDLVHLPAPDPHADGYRSVILQMPDEMEGRRIFYFAIAGMGPSKMFRERRAWITAASCTAWVWCGGITTTTAGRICT